MLALIFLSSEPKEVLMDKLTYLILTEMQEALTVLKSHRDTADLAKKLEGMKCELIILFHLHIFQV